MRSISMTAVSLMAVVYATAATAQDRPPSQSTDPVTSTPDQSRAPSVQGDTTSDAGVPDIVITAERRSTSLQRTGVAATVLTGADLAKKNVLNIDDLQFASPSLTVQDSGQGNQFNIRGIGKAVGMAAVNVGVVTYRDGVATFPGFFQSEPYYDIATIEVLRGPQGTFVGQNATGGAVFITEQNPVLGRVQGYGQFQAGNYKDLAAQGAFNLPIGQKLALRGAFNVENRDSFYNVIGVHGGSPGRLKAESGRLSLLWQPTDQLRVLLKGDYNHIDKGGYAADLALNAAYPYPAIGDPFTVQNNAPDNEAKDEFARVVLNTTWTSAGGLQLRSISGYQVGTSTAIGDLDATIPAANATAAQVAAASQFYHYISNERIASQEFNLISPDTGPFTYVLGAYYQNDRGHYPDGRFYFTIPAGSSFTQGYTQKSTTAGFAQASYQLFDGLKLEAGFRYSRSTSHNTGHPLTILANGTQIVGGTVESGFRDKAATGKVALEWTASRNQFFYAFVATGYKSGGLNANATSPLNQAFKPEHVTDVEAGWKATFFGGHLRTQLGGYYNFYHDFQLRLTDPFTTNIATFQNVPSTTRIYGIEASGQANFGHLGLDFAAGYLHSSLGQFYAADSRVLVAGSPSCNAATGPATASCINLTGRSTPYAPQFTGNVGVQYEIPLYGRMRLTPRINYAHISSTYATVFQNLTRGDFLVPRNIINAQVTLANNALALTGYVTNATNQIYISSVNGNLRYAAPPRQYGARFTYNF